MMKSPQSFHDIINQRGNRLAQIYFKLKKLQQLNQLLEQIIASQLAGSLSAGKQLNTHCRAVNFERNTITLAADSSSWATQLRYRSAIILQALRQYTDWAMVRKIDIIVAQHIGYGDKTGNHYPQRQLSQQNAEKIRATAKGIKDDKLRHILEQLANRA
ncbi:MAG: DUF721 domain-containing protein [Gammaproteobacteria bacterium]|nr:DUF721 domain-containing protein [Gammaproteobacteria bacterium]